MRSSLAASPFGQTSRGFTVFAAIAACLAIAATPTTAAVPWHPDLAQAKAASVISHRPVLIVFTATWSEASVALDGTTLANPEATALVTACFEPVKIDVDADPETTRRMGVSYLPTACVIDLDDRVLATFDCPDSPASFVAAAGRAAQDAAAAKAAASTGTTPTISTPTSSSATAAQPRDRSDFTAAAPATTTVAAAQTAEPSLPKAPPTAWPAETATAPSTGSAPSPASTAAIRPTLEPTGSAAQPAASGVASWLGEQKPTSTPKPTPPSTPAPAPTIASAPAAPPATPPAAPAATPAPEEKPKQANPFVAALQKPFTFLPKWPGSGKPAASSDAASSSATTTSTAATTDAHGSMPLGLEGYCPVTLVEKGKWVEGRAQFGARHRGRTYLFAGADQQRTFLTDPDRYAPALSGDDPVMAFDAGKSTPGQRRYGVTYQSRIYLFSSPESRTAFTADPAKYTARVRLAEASQTNQGAVQR